MKTNNTHLLNPSTDPLPPDASRGEVSAEFGRRLQRAMNAVGLTQSELARRAQTLAPDGMRIARDNISTYINGRAMPNPARLAVIAKALGVEPATLLPEPAVSRGARVGPALEMIAISPKKYRLRVDLNLSVATAMEVLRLINSDKDEEE